VKTLLKHQNANPNFLMPYNGITPFHLVTGNGSETFTINVTKLFLEHGGNPNVKYVLLII
jgi:ankyrin repeat protein